MRKGLVLLLGVATGLLLLALLMGGCTQTTGPAGPAGSAGPAGPAGSAGKAGTSTGTISGMVKDAATGTALEGAAVTTEPATASVTTGADGKYALADVPIGVYRVQVSSTGYRLASKSGVSVTAGKESVVNLSLSVSIFPLAKVRSVSTLDGIKYPEGKVAITLTKGGHDSDVIVTSGLPNVGVGTYVFLEGKGHDAAEKKITAWKWELTPPPGSEAALDDAVSQTPRFLADKAGVYTIKITITNEEGKTASSTMKVTAGTYVGVKNCAICHNGSVKPDIVSAWAQTGHATKFETTFNSYTAERDYCLRCHTVGYDETADNEGFDDAAKAAGWDASQGSVMAWITDTGKTLADIKASPMGNVINIQCENCHGPGSSHTEAKSYEAGTCNQCHGQERQWRYAKHSEEPPLHMAEGTSCVECHSGQGFVEVAIRGKEAIFPDIATKEKPATLMAPGDQPAIGCPACHDPHRATYPEEGKSKQLRLEGVLTIPAGLKVEAGESAVCVKCHANKRTTQYMADFIAGNKTRGAHGNPQADIFFGKGGYEYGESFSNSAHTSVVKNGCISCHMAANPLDSPGPDGKTGTRDDVLVESVGGHSFAVSGKWNWTSDSPDAGEVEVENVGACQSCHADLTTFNRKANGDYDGDGTVEGVQDEVQGLLDLLAAKLPKDDEGNVLSSNIKPDNTTEAQRQALWNYWLVQSDGSRGIHNTSYAVQLLQKTYKHLTGGDVPGATIR